VNDDKSQPWSYATDASADLSGGFSVQFQLPTSFAAAYTVQATGSSGRSATTSFTDGNVNIRVIGPTTATVTWARFATSNCSGAAAGSPSSGSISAGDSGNGTAIPAGADAGQSLRLTAGAVSGFSFANWSGGNFAPSDPSTANPVCLAGDNNTQNTKLTYTGVQNQTITVTTHAPSSAAFNSSFTVAATASSGLAVTYTSAGSCSNIGATFTMNSGTGTCTVKYDQPGNASFNPAPQVTESVTATKLNQTITFAALADKTFGDADFSVSATASSGLAVSFAASGNCTVAGATVHITAAGSCTITASQAGDGNYNAATAVPRTFTIGKAASTTTVTCGAGPFTYTGSAQTPCTASVSGAGGLSQSLTVSYTNNVNAGSATASASFAATANYLTSSDSKNFTIGKAGQSITFGALGDKTFGDADFMVSATSDSGLTVFFSAMGNCSVSPGGMVHLQGAGSCTITASQDGNANYDAASSVPRAFTIAKATSVTTVTCGAGPFTYTGSAQTPCSASVTGPGGLALLLSVGYSNNVNAGTATASASYAESDNYLGSSDSKNFTIGKAASSTVVTCPPSVTYDGSAQTPCSGHVSGAGGLSLDPAPVYNNNTNAGTASASYTYAGDANHDGSSDSKNFTIDKAASATLVTCPASVTYDGSAQTPCMVSVTGGGLNLTPEAVYSNNTNAGTATASYTFAGDSNHLGSNDSETFTIAKATSTTVVTCDAGVTYNGSAQTPCSVAVTGAGGLNLSPDPVYSNNTDAGTATASYTFAGDGNHLGSSDSQTFTIGKAASTTAVSCPASVTYTGSAQTPCSAHVSGAGGLSADPEPAHSNNTNAGTASASYSYAGDANHEGSSDSQTFTIAKASSTTVVSCPASVTYDGSAQTPCSVDVSGAGGLSLTPAPSYTDNTDAGTASASYTYSGDANHEGSSDSQTFTIEKASSETVVACADGPFTFDGTSQTPCSVHVTGAGGLDLHPAPSYSNNVGAGTATASYTFAGDANHNGSDDSKSFTIDKASSMTTVTCAAGSFTYTGAAHTPCSVTVTGAGNLSLVPDPVYSNNTNAGTATASYTYGGDANHTGSSDSKHFTIDKASSTTTVSCGAGPFTYTGSAQTPCSAHVAGAGGLSADPDPVYSNNTDAGTATASYTYGGDANHAGSSDSKHFTIDKASSTTTVTCGAGPFTYTGSAQTPCTAHVSGAGGLSADPDPVYSNNTNAGTATASYTYAGDDDHTGSTDSKNFTIEKAASATAVSCPASVTYDGSAQTPCSVHVTGAGGLDLTPTPSYSNNTNAGTASASYTYGGDANHEGSSDSKDFTIEKASSTTTVSCAAGPFTFDGTSQTPCTVHVSGAGGLDLTPAASYSNNVAAGMATASYTFAGDANHTGSSDSKHFTIDKASSTTVVTCPANVTYNGSAQTPCSVAVTGAGSLSLAPDAAYTNNTNAGTATASYTYGGDANHTGSSDSKNFTIDKAASHTVVTCPVSLIYDGSARTPCSVAVTGAGGLSLTPAPSYSDNTNAGTASASYTYAGDANHDGSTDTKNFTIQKAASHTVVTCPASLIYDGSARTPCTVAVTGAGGLSLTPAASYSHNTDAGTATASYTYAGDANHDGSNDSRDFTINKRNVTASISAADKTYDSTNAASITSCSLETQSSDHGVVSPDAVGCTGSNAHFGNQNAANGKLVTADVSLTGAAQGNYQLTSPTASTTANISMRDVTASVTASAKVYDGTDAAAIATCSLDAQSGNHGAIAGDAVGCSGSNGHFNNKNAANGKPVAGDVALTGLAAGNYHLTSGTAPTTANITKASLNVKAADKTMLINGAVPALTYTFSGFVGGETLATSDVAGSAACSTANGIVAGTFPITCAAGSLSSGNYNFSFTPGTLTVNYAGSCQGAPIGNPILQPVNNDGSSTFKQGSTIPLKFRACDASGASVGPTTAVPNIVASFVLDHTTSGAPGVNETVDSTTPDTAFRWSSTDQQWIFNLSTKNLTNNKMYFYKVTLVGGASFMITFGLK